LNTFKSHRLCRLNVADALRITAIPRQPDDVGHAGQTTVTAGKDITRTEREREREREREKEAKEADSRSQWKVRREERR